MDKKTPKYCVHYYALIIHNVLSIAEGEYSWQRDITMMDVERKLIYKRPHSNYKTFHSLKAAQEFIKKREYEIAHPYVDPSFW